MITQICGMTLQEDVIKFLLSFNREDITRNYLHILKIICNVMASSRVFENIVRRNCAEFHRMPLGLSSTLYV